MLDITYPAVILAAKTYFKAFGINIEMTGTEHVPRTGGAVIASNHIGYVDFIFNGYAANPSKRKVRFMAKTEAFANPFVGALMRSFHHIEVNRAHGEESLLTAIDYVRRGEVVGIFPEATISRSFEIKEFKTGAVRIAAEGEVPLIPMAVWGTHRIKTKDHPSDLWSRGKQVLISVGEPLFVSGDDPIAETDILRERVKALHADNLARFGMDPAGQWWAPASIGGSAPTPQRAAEMDAAELAARAARKAQ